MIEIYAAAWLRDVQIGSVRVLISNVQIDVQIVSTPSSLPPASASTTSSTPRPPPGVRRISMRRPPMLVVPIPIGTIPLLTGCRRESAGENSPEKKFVSRCRVAAGERKRERKR
ncbi:unnamed protein product [Linum trigynum]|uniref:Uncharacterized protein n=1 Tax=Linum trigynum TaxID=586398 RepID=A0AAV2F3X2_9ROSI